uniref:Uncharacterized protein n=1 Tax=viral metagenome TaxID=1070528 RepID=A0A6M3IH44_9ZZZZ
MKKGWTDERKKSVEAWRQISKKIRGHLCPLQNEMELYTETVGGTREGLCSHTCFSIFKRAGIHRVCPCGIYSLHYVTRMSARIVKGDFDS